MSVFFTIAPLEAHHGGHHGNHGNHHGYGHCGTEVTLNVPASLWIGDMLKNKGEITLKGEGSNIIVGKDLHNCGTISSDFSLYCRRVHKEGELNVKEIEQEGDCIYGPDNLFEKNYVSRISEATYIFTSNGEVIKEGVSIAYGEYSTGGVTFSWDNDEWNIEGNGYINGSIFFETGVKLSSVWIDLLGDLTVKGSMYIDSDSTLILQSINWPGLLVKGMLKVYGYGRFNTGIYAGQMMTGEGATLEIYSGLYVARNLQNAGEMEVKFSQTIMKKIADRIKLLNNENNKKILTIQYANGVSDTSSIGIAIFAPYWSNTKDVFSGKITDVSYRVLGTNRKLGVDLGGGLIPPQVLAYKLIEQFKEEGYKEPVLLQLLFIPPSFFYGEFMDAVTGTYLGIFRLGGGFEKVEKSFFKIVDSKIKEFYYSLPETLTSSWRYMRDLEWSEFLDQDMEVKNYNTQSMRLSTPNRYSFKPKGINVCVVSSDKVITVPGFKKNKVLDEHLKNALNSVLWMAATSNEWSEYEWIGCTPTSSALIFRYWGWRFSNYNSCLPANTTLLVDLHKEMKTTDSGITVNPEDIVSGIENVASKYGLEYRAYWKYFLKTPYDFLYNQIVNGKPVLHSYTTKQMLKELEGHSAFAYGVREVVMVTSVGGVDDLCPDRHYVELIFGDGDFGDLGSRDDLGFKEHRIDPWAVTPSWLEVSITPVHGCPDNGGGSGGGGGCSETSTSDAGFFFFVLLFIWLLKKYLKGAIYE